tara:strand:- start:42085 stop:44364 length:2280 start_codon:yes stop_codon:yes gene_type:complete
MFTNNLQKKNDMELEIKNKNLSKELEQLKIIRNHNNDSIFYNKNFINSIKERPKKNFSMISSSSVVNVTEKYLEQKYKNSKTKDIKLFNRVQNYDIEHGFCLKFEKNTNNMNNNNNDNRVIQDKNSHYINYNSDSDSEYSDKEEEEEEIFNIKQFEDEDNILINPKISKRNIKIIPKEDVQKNIIDKYYLKEYLQKGSIINNYQFVSEELELDKSIPLICYTTWHTKNTPPLMRQNFNKLCENNTEITFKFFDENDCINFIENNFDDQVLNAYKCLAPSSYKSDLWRYCILFINGGIYLDIKYNTINNFKLKYLCTQEHFVFDHFGKDKFPIWEDNEFGIYTSLIVCKPNNEILRDCIDAIIDNVQTYNYGKNALYPTGPGILGKNLIKNKYDKDMNFIKEIMLFHQEDSSSIIYNNVPILDVYKSYREEQIEYQNNLHYSQLWKLNSIYNKNFNILHKKTINTKESHLPSIVCIVHIGSYHIFIKMKSYIDNLIKAKYDEYNIDFYFNIIDTIRRDHIANIRKDFPNENIIISENYGFDIGSFFHILQIIKTYNENYDYVIKIHTKTNNDLRNELLKPILGTIDIIRNIIDMFDKNEKIGIVASKKSRCIDKQADFLRNKDYLQQFVYWYFNEKTNIIKQVYSTGTIFWMRFDILKKIFFGYNINNIYNSFNNIDTFDFNWYYYANKKYLNNIPQEKDKIYNHYYLNGKKMNLSGNLFHALKNKTNSEKIRDGMIEHAYERFFGYIIHRIGYKFKFIN